jgi:hypothetical protein
MQMKARSLFYWLGIVSTGLLVTCGDIIVKDISSEEVFLLAPANGVTLDSGNVGFWWDPVDGAIDYRFSLVSPSFDSAKYFFVDSITEDHSFFVSLGEGDYQWGVSAANSEYSTDFYYASFTIVSDGDTTEVEEVPDISDHIITLLSPRDQQVLDSARINFWWEADAVIDSFHFTLVTPDFAAPDYLIVDTLISSSKITLTLNAGNYAWRVAGLNQHYKTANFEASFTINEAIVEGPVDLSDSVVSLLTPSDGLTLDRGDVVFWWEAVEGATSYELLILAPDFTNPTKIVFEATMEELREQVTLDSGSYQWGVKAINEQSESQYSVRSLQMQ